MSAPTESEFVANYRADHPKSRVQFATKLVINTSSRKRRICLRCGQEGPGWAAKWPETKGAAEWNMRHRNGECS